MTIPEVPLQYRRRFLGKLSVQRKKFVKQVSEEGRATWIEVPPEEEQGEWYVELQIENLSWDVPFGAYIRRYQYTGDPRRTIGWRRFIRALRDAGVEAKSLADIEGKIFWFEIFERTLPSGSVWEEYLPAEVPSEEEILALEKRKEAPPPPEEEPVDEGIAPETELLSILEAVGEVSREDLPEVLQQFEASRELQEQYQKLLSRLLRDGKVKISEGKIKAS